MLVRVAAGRVLLPSPGRRDTLMVSLAIRTSRPPDLSYDHGSHGVPTCCQGYQGRAARWSSRACPSLTEQLNGRALPARPSHPYLRYLNGARATDSRFDPLALGRRGDTCRSAFGGPIALATVVRQGHGLGGKLPAQCRRLLSGSSPTRGENPDPHIPAAEAG